MRTCSIIMSGMCCNHIISEGSAHNAHLQHHYEWNVLQPRNTVKNQCTQCAPTVQCRMTRAGFVLQPRFGGCQCVQRLFLITPLSVRAASLPYNTYI